MRPGILFVVIALILTENGYAQYRGDDIRQRYFRPIYPSYRGIVRTHEPSSSNINVQRQPVPSNAIQKVRLDVYYATDCPDSMQFFTDQLYPLYKEMGDALDIHLVPYGKARERYNPVSQKSEFRCQHGPSECYGNTVQSCAMSLYSKDEYMTFIDCMMAYPRPSNSGHKCARRLSLDWEKIDKCAKGMEGNRLLHKMAELTESLNPRLYFVPWIVVNKVHSGQNQRMALRDLKSVVCEAYEGIHESCAD